MAVVENEPVAPYRPHLRVPSGLLRSGGTTGRDRRCGGGKDGRTGVGITTLVALSRLSVVVYLSSDCSFGPRGMPLSLSSLPLPPARHMTLHWKMGTGEPRAGKVGFRN